MLQEEKGITVWYDEYSLELGDSLRRGIDKGLTECNFGLVILSKAFFAKEWPQKELDALATRESNEGNKIILPVWHDITKEEISERSALLADKLGASTSEGLPAVLKKILRVLKKKNKIESKEVVYNFGEQNVVDWKSCIREAFEGKKATSKTWTDLNDMVRILSHISKPNQSHCFLPGGGGLDLERVSRSLDRDCIELGFGSKSATIIKPKLLEFSNFTGFPSLSYFRIETSPLEPKVWNKEDCKYFYEELIELSPLKYDDRSVWDGGHIGYDEFGNEIPIPEDARVISRYIGGTFVIFAKGSFYNTGLSGKYDAYSALHQKMTSTEFTAIP